MKSVHVSLTTAAFPSSLHVMLSDAFFLRAITAAIIDALPFDLRPKEAIWITIPLVFQLKV